MENVKVYIFDSTNNLLGYAITKTRKLYDSKGQLVQGKIITQQTTIKQLRDYLLNQKTRST